MLLDIRVVVLCLGFVVFAKGQENLLLERDVTCSASINNGDCAMVYDNIFLTNNPNFKWDYTDPTRSPQWIHLQFSSDVTIGYVQLIENGNLEKNIRDVTILFSDGTQQQVHLPLIKNDILPDFR